MLSLFLWSNSHIGTWKSITTGKTIALTIQTVVSKVMCLLFNMLSRFVLSSFYSKGQASFNFMAAVTILTDFGVQENKICHCFHFLFFYLSWSDGTGCCDPFSECWVLSRFSLSSFTLIKRLSSSSSLSAIRVVSSAYLRLLIFLPAIFTSACDSSSPACCTMYSACKLNKQADNIQPFVFLSQFWPVHCSTSAFKCCFYRFLRRLLRWSGNSISWRIFHNLWSTQSWQPTPGSLPGESHGQRRLVGYSS